ncbi:putative transposase [Bradyrhizobium niftali]|uniref:IS3 family transposase n=1 Tax=Bradyrhizobium niftali TaxID=2560055 RepID=UPI003838336C
MTFRFIEDHRDTYPVRLMCAVLEVSPAGYYAWRERPVSARTTSNAALLAEIRQVHRDSGQRYGSPRIHAALRTQGRGASRGRIERLMRRHGIRAIMAPPRRVRTTDSRHALPIAPNLIARDFTAAAPNRIWLADITYIPTAEGWLYLAAVMDLFSRKIVGWAMRDHMRVELVSSALSMALRQQRPAAGLVHHSDRGVQGGSKRSSQHLNEGGCDERSKATITPFWTSAVAVTGTTAGSGAICTPAILVGDRAGDDQRGCCIGGWYVAACRNQIVPTGGRHGTSDVQIFDQAAVRAVPLVCGT